MEQHRESERAGSRALSGGRLAWTCLIALAGFVGALPLDPPGPRVGADPLFAVTWAALLAPIAGAAAAGLRLPPWPYGLAAPASWAFALVWASAASQRLVPTPLWSAAAWMGLFALGAACVAPFERDRARAVFAVALASAAANVAVFAPGWLGSRWPPNVASVLLDLAPVTFVAECAGVDWMRQAGVYEIVQTDRFERAAWSGQLAGPVCLVVGYAAWAALHYATRRRRASAS